MDQKKEARIAALETEVRRLRGAVVCFADSIQRVHAGITFRCAARRIAAECHGKPQDMFNWEREGR